MHKLKEAHGKLSADVDKALKADLKKLERLANQNAQLHAPLSNEEAEYSAKGADGRHRTVKVPIKEAIASFEQRLETTVTSLQGLWQSWDAAQAEIQSIAASLTSSSQSAERGGRQDPDWVQLIDELEGSVDSAGELETQLKELYKETAETFKKQEKVRRH